MIQTLGLVMIVRDERDNIVRCLNSVKDRLAHWTIVDTGSTDGTQDLIRETLKGVPGDLVEREWEGFGPNRSQAMRLAKGTADYLVLLDADMVLHLPDPLPFLVADCYQGRILGSSNDYTLPFLVSGRLDWRYEGVAHSYLACDSPYSEEELPGLAVDDFSSTGPEKLQGDLVLLSAELARNPLDARTAFYLAQTYYDLDRFPEAIAAYRYRAHLDGWAEETFYAKYMLGVLLCEHVSFNEGCKALMDAWNFRPSRIEPLRALANVANSVADKAPYPVNDRLFVHRNKYAAPANRTPQERASLPPVPSLDPGLRRRVRLVRSTLKAKDVSAILVTRGNVDLEPCLTPVREAGITDIVVWNNSVREHDYKVFGRYAAIPETKNPVLFWLDDDVIFTAFPELFAEYEPGRLVGNMDQGWIDGAGYGDFLCMVGAGSLCDAHLPAEIFGRYLAVHPFDDDLLVEADFAFGTMAPFRRVDVGYETREFTDDSDRLYQSVGQTQRKWAMIKRGLELKAQEMAA